VGTDDQETGYLVWRRFAELAGDRAMAARLHIIYRARQAGCRMTLPQPDGTELRFPEMIAAEAAVGALDKQSEEEWRRRWIRRLLNLAVKWQDSQMTDNVATLLSTSESVVAELKSAGVWPWQNEKTEGA
jgi:hypothetical protein